MKHIHQRNINLLSEFTSYLINLGCDNIQIDIKTKGDTLVISFNSINPNLTEKSINELITILNIPRRKDIEEYYWQLNGIENFSPELSLIGMMIDSAKVSYINNNLNVKITRLP